MRKLITKFIARGIYASIVIVFSTSAFAGYVDLQVTGTGVNTKLKMGGSNVYCSLPKKNCIVTKKGAELDLDFKLFQACKSGGPKYKLSGMQLSMIQRIPDPANPGQMIKAFGVYNLPAIVMRDFDAVANGTIKWGNTSGNNNKLQDDKIKIKDKNKGEYVVFFQIEASKCDAASPGPDTIYLDPRIENTGNP